jgi:diguanylate cyclase (GGDEF)-like protein
MSDNIPQPNPERDSAPDSAPAEAPADGLLEQPVQGQASSGAEPLEPNAEPLEPNAEPLEPNAEPLEPNAEPLEPNAEPLEPNAEPLEPGAEPQESGAEPRKADADVPPATTATASGGDRLERVKHAVRSRTGAWAAVAMVCVLAGIVASVLGARAVTRNDAAGGRRAFQQSSTSIASTLKLAIRHEEQLLVSAGTFFAGHPNASPAEFQTWVRWARTTHRYPEIDQLALLALVRAPELPAFQARLAGRAPAVKPLRAATATPAGGGVRIAPSSGHRYYCLAVADLSRSAAVTPPAGFDYCAQTSALLLSRNAGVGIYEPTSAGRAGALEVVTPVYRGYLTPHTVVGREAASVGWLREVLTPGVVLHQALTGQPGYALRLRYRAGSSNVVFAAGGVPRPDAQSAASSFHNGWTVRTFGPAAGAGVFANGHALALLIGGCLLSVLLGLLVFVLGADRPRTQAPKTGEAPSGGSTREDLYDALTGLPNRVLMLDRAERILARAGRHSEVIAGALSIEIDWVKDVNDRLGRPAGDQLLKIVAQRLERVIRTGDTVGRLGGDEFVILVESAARGVRLDSLARRVIEALHEPVELDGFGPSFVLTASIGVAFGRYTIAEDLLRDAHLAAKAAGKDRYTLFNANMRSVIEGRGVLEVELNRALGEGQFFLLYQPIYDLNPRRVAGVEALIRWQHPEQGILAPADFIPLAEETGLIVPIGRWVLEEACSRAAAWNVAGHRGGVSVKVSAVQLNRDGFATDVRRALQQSGIEPSLLTLEISEPTVMRGVETAAERLREIKQLGVRIALDDFGSAYASHSDLQRLPLDCLKVDRSSLAASDTEDYRSWLLETILLAGRELSLRVIAKGIETGEQLAALEAKGCTMAQGVFMGAPIPVDAVESLFNAELATTPASPTGLAH